MNNFYQSCLSFNHISQKDFDQTEALRALRHLYALYQAADYAPDPNYLVRAELLMDTLAAHRQDADYPLWQIWFRYFISMGYSEWNEMWKSLEDKTITYYDQHANEFVSDTVSVDFTQTQEAFLKYLQKGNLILDFGCGSGRDTKYFLNQGMQVDAVDGSEAMCRVASAYTGMEVRQMLFQDLDAKEMYDGIWACSSILHLPKSELKDVFGRMTEALKDDGVLYTSFKYGEFEGERNGRYFTDFTEDTFREFSQDLSDWKIRECWTTGDVRPGRGEEKWLNLIMQKNRI